jgi:hypothetical protein
MSTRKTQGLSSESQAGERFGLTDHAPGREAVNCREGCGTGGRLTILEEHFPSRIPGDLVCILACFAPSVPCLRLECPSILCSFSVLKADPATPKAPLSSPPAVLSASGASMCSKPDQYLNLCIFAVQPGLVSGTQVNHLYKLN